jgi:hypothetical protein
MSPMGVSEDRTMASSHSVTRLLEQFKQGDRQAAGPLWERSFTRLVHLARTWFPRPPTTAAASAEDAALGAFASFCRRAEQDGFSRLFDRDDLWQSLSAQLPGLRTFHWMRSRPEALTRVESALAPRSPGFPVVTLSAKSSPHENRFRCYGISARRGCGRHSG